MKHINKELLHNNIKNIALYDLDENNLYGSSYIVYQNGEIVYKKHFGTTAPDTANTPDDRTLYRLASMTKPITAVAVLILTERGFIKLEDRVDKYLPQFKDVHIADNDGNDMGVTATPITILHLLTHTSGIGSIRALPMTDTDRATIDSLVNFFANAGLDFEPFSREAYSAVAAFDVAAAIAEKVTGRDYGEFLKTEIFDKCGMSDTVFSPSDEQWRRMMTMHQRTNDGKSLPAQMKDGCVFGNFPQNHKLAGAGLASTLYDYSLFAKMLLNGGMAEKGRVLSEEVLNLMSTPHVPESIMPGDQRWGLGVRVITKDSYPSLPVGTFGWSGAYGSHFWVDPTNKIYAVFMKNSQFDGGAGNKSACRFEKAVYDSIV